MVGGAKSQTRPQALDSVTLFCGTVSSIRNAETVLKASQTVFLDSEGVDLGRRGGTLSILSIGAIPQHSPQRLHIYLIDVASTPFQHLRPIFDLLASSDVTKVVWDGRMDYSALYHDHGIRMRNVIDLQIVDILSREFRDTPEQHLKRFNGYVRKDLLQEDHSKERYARLHRLNGLLQAVQEHEPAGYKCFRKDRVDHQLWNTRPLPAGYVGYAAMDVKMIASLYHFFHFCNYIPSRTIDTHALISKCSRYIAFWEDRQPSVAARESPFYGNGFLPLGIIDISPTNPAVISNEQKHKCAKCDRLLTKATFPRTGLVSGSGEPLYTQHCCWVCVAVAENASFHQRCAAAAMRRARKAAPKPPKQVRKPRKSAHRKAQGSKSVHNSIQSAKKTSKVKQVTATRNATRRRHG